MISDKSSDSMGIVCSSNCSVSNHMVELFPVENTLSSLTINCNTSVQSFSVSRWGKMIPNASNKLLKKMFDGLAEKKKNRSHVITLSTGGDYFLCHVASYMTTDIGHGWIHCTLIIRTRWKSLYCTIQVSNYSAVRPKEICEASKSLQKWRTKYNKIRIVLHQYLSLP